MADLRRCSGSARFGIEPHEAPIEDFPAQPSRKDGLGRMCKPHWNQYTAGLARDAKSRKVVAADAGDGIAGAEQPSAPKVATEISRRRAKAEPVAAPREEAAPE